MKAVKRDGIDTRRSKEDWIKFISWWMGGRQSFDPMPKKLRRFKKNYNRALRLGRLRLFKFEQECYDKAGAGPNQGGVAG